MSAPLMAGADIFPDAAMSIHVKLSSTLRPHVPGYDPQKGLTLEMRGAPATPALLAAQIGLPPGEIKFVMLNGRHSPMDMALADGDRIAFFPDVGGG